MIKKLLSHIGKYKTKSILSPIIICLESLFTLYIPYLMANLIDFGIEKSDMHMITYYGIILSIFFIISLILGIIAGIFSADASSGFAANLRKDMYKKVLSFSFYNLDKFNTGSIVTRMTTDVNNVQHTFMMIIRGAIRAPSMLIFAFIMLFNINTKIAFVFLCLIPFLGIIFYILIGKVYPKMEQVFKTYDLMNQNVEENIRGIREVKAFVKEKKAEKDFNKISEKLFKLFSNAERLIRLSEPFIRLCLFGLMLFVSWIGARLIVSNELTTGQLMSIFTFCSTILFSFVMLSVIIVMFSINRASMKRIVELFDEEVTIKDVDNPIDNFEDGSIEFKNVCFSYNNESNIDFLSNISLKIESGESVGIVGSTGSGKTTLLNLIPRLYDVRKGSVEVNGKDVKKYKIAVLRKNISYVLQNDSLFSGTIIENMRWGNEEASFEEIRKACSIAEAEEFINELPDKYEAKIEQNGANLSGGQNQRLFIARALLKNPRIIIFDDSISALDTQTAKKISENLKVYKPYITKIIVAQRIDSIKNADKIIVMDNGSINQIGTHEELLKENDIYKEIASTQCNEVIDE